ncbi:S8 family peptidase [Clostridium sp. KNHs205]|jgi:subtilisin family serine protease|uniref:S8 family peptidase n=1 Tax=Clostridium sp. KNHs205 TaxID=1449050 RepID=UPI00051BDBFF|nr:S8 family peptidase [Clostridium sp. KNHs205]
MNNENINEITSQNYADLIVDWTISNINRSDFTNSVIQDINSQYGVIHIPVEEITADILQQYGYSAMPACYGITTYRNEVIESAYTIQQFELEDIKGNGILIGIVDSGIDYRNDAFRKIDGTTKIRYIWDQTLETGLQPEGFGYGAEYSKDDIDYALMQTNPYDYVPSIDDIGEGTAMAAIAAGNKSESSAFTGIAINAELVIVKLKTAKDYLRDFYGIKEDAVCYQQNDIMLGVKYLIETAQRLNMPIAICMGLSSSQGAHDGYDIMSRYLTECGSNNGVGLAVAVGNEGNQGLHFLEIKPAEEKYSLAELNVGSDNTDFTMEFWTYIQNPLSLSIFSPDNTAVFRIDTLLAAIRNGRIEYGDTIIYYDLFGSEVYSQKKLILLRFKNTSKGVWRFQIEEGEGVVSLCHIWLPIRNFLKNDIYFLNPNANTTISIPGNATQLITVTSYNAIVLTLAESAGRGFTSNNIPKPDIAAPGENMIVPILEGGFYPLSGSGLATAFTAGVLAAILEGGELLNVTDKINTPLLRFILTYLARRDSDKEYPNPDWGYGYIV